MWGGGGGGVENTEIELEIHIKETEGVLIRQLSLQLSRLDKMICFLTLSSLLTESNQFTP